MLRTLAEQPCDALDVRQSLRDRLSQKKDRLQGQLNDTTEALDALQNNPEVAKVIEMVLKAGY